MSGVNKDEILNEIREHLLTHGSRNWGQLRERYAGMSEPTFWRRVREAKALMRGQQLAIPQSRNVVFVEGPKAYGPPAPGVVAANVLAGGVRDVDHVVLYQGLYDEAEKLRFYALHPDGSIRYPNAFERAVKLKARLTMQGAQVISQMYGIKSSLAFYDALVAECALEVPDIRKRLMDRLYSVGEKEGMW
jgi:hypothetical protein